MSDIDEIKARLNIVDIVGKRIELKKAGRNFKALCPFHAEKSPSFIVSPDRQTFHCFGCGKGGSVFDFVMLFDHIDFPEALEMLADLAGVKLERRPQDSPETKMRQQLFEVNHLASEYYQYLLTKHAVGEHAREYLKHRGVSDKSIKTFGLGYSPNDWDGLLGYLKKKGYTEQLLDTAGLIIRGSRGYYDRFRGRVMFTLKDHRGNVVGFAGRVMDPAAKEAKYINTSETPIYKKSKMLYGLDVTKDAIQKENQAILMEGELDVISSFQAGIANVVAIKGSAVTEEHARLLRRFTDRLIFALDSDLAGDAAARRGIDIAEKSGFDMKVAVMPSGKDPDEAARENPGLLKKAFKQAVPIYDYFLSSALRRFDGSSSYGKKKVSEELLPVLAQIENPIVQGHYLRAMAKALDVSEETIQEGLVKVRSGRPASKTKQPDAVEKPVRSRLEKAELYLLALLLQGKTRQLYEELAEVYSVAMIKNPPVRQILTHLDAFLGEHPVFLAKDFADSLPSELTQTFDEAFLWDISGFLEDEERFVREWDKAMREVRRLSLRAQIEEMSKSLRDGAKSTDKETGDIESALKELTGQLAALEKSA